MHVTKLQNMFWTLLVILLTAACQTDSNTSTDSSPDEAPTARPIEPDGTRDAAPKQVRIATYNVSLYRDAHGQLMKDLADGRDQQIDRIAKVIQHVRPDILLLNEFDYDREHRAIDLFLRKYLAVDHGPTKAIDYPHVYLQEVNTGIPSGVDLDQDGKSDGWNDCIAERPGTASIPSGSARGEE